MAADPQWLDDDEREAWIALVPVLLLLPGALEAQLQADSQMTFYEYIVLSALSEKGGDGLRMSDLAAVTSGSLPRLSQVVTRMEDKSWVERRADPADRRAARVHLLRGGRAVLEPAAPGHVAAVRRHIFDNLSATQVRQLRSIAWRIAMSLTPADSLLSERSAPQRAPRRRRA